MAAKAPLVGVGRKLSAAFIAVSLVIAGLVTGAIITELKTIERAALLEAEHIAKMVAYTGPGNTLSNPEFLQSYVDGLYAMHGRDLVFVDSNKRGIADADKRSIGEVFNQDPGGEVGQTIQDGRARIFVERNEQHPQGVKQIVVPLHVSQTNSDSAIIGAAIVEYTHIYDGLLAAEQKSLYVLGATGIGCVLLSMIFGLRVAAQMARRLRGLQNAADIVAEGNYETEVSVVPPDEIGMLGAAFNTMAGALSRHRDEQKQSGNELRASEGLKRAILESSLDCLIVIDHEGMIAEFNAAAETTFGISRKQALGKSMADLIVPPRLRDAHHRGFARYLATGEGPILGKRIELVAMRADGTEFPVELSITPIGSGPSAMFAGSLRDITGRREADVKINRLNRVYAVLSGINSLIVRVRDREELYRGACRIAFEQGRFPMSWIGVVDRTTMRVTPVASSGTTQGLPAALNQRFSLSQDPPPANSLLATAIREKKAVFSNDVQTDPRVMFKEELSKRESRSMAILPLQIADEVVGVLALYSEEIGFFDDEEVKLLTELARNIAFAIDHIGRQERLEYLAYYDELTGLANRTLFLERVAQNMRSAVSGGHKLALFLIDLERFRNINDTLGRPAGDALLKQVAEWLTRDAGDANLVARVGTDHFAAVLPEVKPEHGARSLEKAMTAFLEHPFRLNDAVFRIAVKIGVATFPEDGADADTLFRNAEAALKKAKASGERYVFYSQSMNDRVAEKLSLENQLRQALDKGEFVLHYQPKVNLASGLLTSCEALIRWNDPRTGLVPPGRFIPILEETGLILEVGRWALRKAIEEYLRWRNAGLAAMRIAVNVSPLQLRNRNFVDEIKLAIGVDAQAADGLELEITESLIMEDAKHSIASLQAIRAMGVTIAIDDFGTGFSSLSYLAKLPVDTLKIDRSFVIDMTAGPLGLSLVSTIINLAHSLKLKVVAEGVETEEQSHLLRLLRCDEMQGFLFSKPVPSEVFEAKFLAPPPAG